MMEAIITFPVVFFAVANAHVFFLIHFLLIPALGSFLSSDDVYFLALYTRVVIGFPNLIIGTFFARFRDSLAHSLSLRVEVNGHNDALLFIIFSYNFKRGGKNLGVVVDMIDLDGLAK